MNTGAYLMMNVVVCGIIPKQELHGVKGQTPTTVVMRCLGRSNPEEECTLPGGHPAPFVRKERTNNI
jgi:hypothetical protein